MFDLRPQEVQLSYPLARPSRVEHDRIWQGRKRFALSVNATLPPPSRVEHDRIWQGRKRFALSVNATLPPSTLAISTTCLYICCFDSRHPAPVRARDVIASGISAAPRKGGHPGNPHSAD
jgi:hypothetical protein